MPNRFAPMPNRFVPMPKQVREIVPKYVPPHKFVPFLERFIKTKLDKQYGKFIELLK
jgi:hypothetical protein